MPNKYYVFASARILMQSRKMIRAESAEEALKIARETLLEFGDFMTVGELGDDLQLERGDDDVIRFTQVNEYATPREPDGSWQPTMEYLVGPNGKPFPMTDEE